MTLEWIPRSKAIRSQGRTIRTCPVEFPMEVASIGFVAAPFGNWRSQFWSRSSTSQPCGTVGKVSDERDCDPSDTREGRFAELESGHFLAACATGLQGAARHQSGHVARPGEFNSSLPPTLGPDGPRCGAVGPNQAGASGQLGGEWNPQSRLEQGPGFGKRRGNVAIRWPGAPGSSRS
jgi:hypothetical protein